MKLHLLRAIKTLPCVQRKAKWALKWCDSTTASFAECMIAFAVRGNIQYSSWGFFLRHLLAEKARFDAGAMF